MTISRIQDPEVQLLATLSATLEGDYAPEPNDPWVGSPFAWILKQPSRTKGAIAEKLVAGWCATKGFDVIRSPDSDADRVVEGHRIEIKFSTMWKTGVYKFQRIRNKAMTIAFVSACPPSMHTRGSCPSQCFACTSSGTRVNTQVRREATPPG
jgi:hypothetical protein